MGRHALGVNDIEKIPYIILWSFDNPTDMIAVAVGANEEEATVEIQANYGERPNFRINEIREATDEDLERLKITPELLRELAKPRVVN